jgi:hypothetical protein
VKTVNQLFTHTHLLLDFEARSRGSLTVGAAATAAGCLGLVGGKQHIDERRVWGGAKRVTDLEGGTHACQSES